MNTHKGSQTVLHKIVLRFSTMATEIQIPNHSYFSLFLHITFVILLSAAANFFHSFIMLNTILFHSFGQRTHLDAKLGKKIEKEGWHTPTA